MADNVTLPGTGAVVATDEVTDATLGVVQVQYVKLMDGTLNSTNKVSVSAAGAVKVDGSAVTQPVSGSVSVSGTATVAGTVAANNFPTTVTTNTGNSDASTIRVVIATNQPALSTSMPVNTTGQSVAVDGSGSTNVTPSTSTVVFGSTPTNGFEFTNIDANDIWINDNGAAAISTAGSIRIPPGGTYTTPVGYKPIGDVRTISAVASQKYTARRW